MFIRGIFWALVIYFGYKVYQGYLIGKKEREEAKVKGKRKKKALNLSDLDVEDASFREIKKDDGRKNESDSTT